LTHRLWKPPHPTVWSSGALGLNIVLAMFIYVVPDGFDLGFGTLFRRFPVGQDRDTVMNSIAPVWDGNETWLAMGGGGLLAAFPVVTTSRAWALKASFGAFWGYHSTQCAQNYFDAWTTRAMRVPWPAAAYWRCVPFETQCALPGCVVFQFKLEPQVLGVWQPCVCQRTDSNIHCL
jgi:hypothetical protein